MSTSQRVILIVLTLVWAHLFIYVVFADRGLVGVRHATTRYEALRQRNGEWIRKNLILERQIERLRQDPAYIEQTARMELGMVRPSEMVFSFSQELSSTGETGATAADARSVIE